MIAVHCIAGTLGSMATCSLWVNLVSGDLRKRSRSVETAAEVRLGESVQVPASKRLGV